LYVDIMTTGANRDLHSGNFGGPVPNPATALADLLSSLWADDGRVALAEFYDDVRPLTDRDREILEAIPIDETAVKADLGLSGLAIDDGENYAERLLCQPNLNVAGLDSGVHGEGMMTVLPSKARAKIDFRLVADQDPERIFESLSRHAEEQVPPGVDVTLTRVATMAPQRTPAESPVVEPMMQAVSKAWDTEPILKPSLGGSVPTYVFADVLDTPCLVVPYANADENNHAPDENIALSCFRAGSRTTAELLTEFADAPLK
jgi:acetylornithine deacetylase/succinyl-diaminopimelate desuccinylase-like protein